MPHEMEWRHSVPLAFFLLAISIFTTTFPKQNSSLRWLRLLLGIPGLWAARWVTYPPIESVPMVIPEPGIYIQVFMLGCYLFTRMIEVCFMGFWDDAYAWPKWQVAKEKADGDGDGDGITYVKVPIPTTLVGRLAYTLDSMITLRGESLFKRHSWEWATKDIREYQPSRIDFAIGLFKHFAIFFTLFDICELILYSRRWDLRSSGPITSLPAAEQLFYTLVTAVVVYAGSELPGLFRRLFLVCILQFPPNAFPPLVLGNPLNARSLSELWSHTWHSMWRRTFDRMARPITWILQHNKKRLGRLPTNFLYSCVIFSLSALFHNTLYYGIPPQEHIDRPLFERKMGGFFLVQPLGVLFEILVVFPLTERLPGRWKVMARRMYLWSWLLWTGRWFADGNMLTGQFDRRAMDFSPAAMTVDWWQSGSVAKAI